jgi:hypothetical protein
VLPAEATTANAPSGPRVTYTAWSAAAEVLATEVSSAANATGSTLSASPADRS